MKRQNFHPAPSQRELHGPKYWRSLDELAQTPGFREKLAREFPAGADRLDGVDRRNFLKLMAASFALGGVGMAGCRRPEANILPFGKSVEGFVPGLPVYYATAMPQRRIAVPLLAETHQGRPTKLEGNPAYEPHGGSTSLAAQASLLDLYDPDRATEHTQNGNVLAAAAVADLLAGIGTAAAADQGAGLAFLAGASSSPTRARLVAALRAKFPQAKWAEYEPVTDEPPAAASQAVFGRPLRPIYQFAQAKRVVSIDADFLQAEAGSLYYAREFAKGRRVKTKEDPMNRLYVAESGFTLTGSMADHRLRLASSRMVGFAAALYAQVTGDHAYDALAQGLEVPPGWIAECAADLAANKARTLVLAGSHLPAAAQALAYGINAALGNLGIHRAICGAGRAGRPRHRRPGGRGPRGDGQDPRHPRGQSGLQRPGRLGLGRAAEERAAGGAPGLPRGRDLRRGGREPRGGALSGIVGRRPDARRHGRAGAADDPAAVRRPERNRGPGPDRRRGDGRSVHPGRRDDRPARRRRRRGRLPAFPARRPAGRFGLSRGSGGFQRRGHRGPGEHGSGARRPCPSPAWRSASSPTTRSTTDGTRTTAGCRSVPIR